MNEVTEVTKVPTPTDSHTIVIAFQGTPAGDALDGVYYLTRLPLATADDDSGTVNFAAIVCGFVVITACYYRGDGWDVTAIYTTTPAVMFRTKARAGDVEGGTVEFHDGGTAQVFAALLP